MTHAVDQLREFCLRTSTRPFKARGSSVVRCKRCMMAQSACICPWQTQQTIPLEFILIMHRKEVYKTTNSGRLIADLFPEQTHAFLWDRTKPDPALLELLSDDRYHTRVLFPEDGVDEAEEQREDGGEEGREERIKEEKTSEIESANTSNKPDKPQRIVLLDGTWKQASRMVRLSQWLKTLPRISIHPEQQSHTYIRQAIREGQLSTAQAAACLLKEQGLETASDTLHHYFAVFNQHCIATRRNITPEITESHRYLQARVDAQTN